MVLYSIEKGRRGVVKLVCRLLCIDEMLVSAGRALLIPAAIMHKAQRIEAKINKKDEQQKAFWLGLGFELHEDIAEMPIDAALLGRTSDFVPIATDGAENDIDGAADEPVSDLYIRKTCPGRGEPHMVLMPCGEIPRDPAVWHLVPENELELGHTVQCLQCKITFAVDRDQAESAEVLFQDLE